MEQYVSVTQAASEVIQHALENLHLIVRQDELSGEILAAVTIVNRVGHLLDDRRAFVQRWEKLLPSMLRQYGRSSLAIIVEHKLAELL